MSKHKLYVIEGLDGCGKTTVAQKIGWLHPEIKVYHEPWGTIGTFIRDHARGFDSRTKMMLFAAARREFVVKELIPALEENDVLLDRFTASTIAYQVFGDGNRFEAVQDLLDESTEGLQAIDKTIFLDISPETRQERIGQRSDNDGLDDYEADYFARIAHHYRPAIEATSTKTIDIVNAEQSSKEVLAEVEKLLGLEQVRP